MGERQGKKLHSTNTNGGLPSQKKCRVVSEKRGRDWKEKKGRTFRRGPGCCCSEVGLWDGDGQLRAVDRGAGDSRNGEGVGTGQGIGSSAAGSAPAAAAAAASGGRTATGATS